MIKKILVANRGEIAIRVMRTARELGIKTVAVFSDADTESLHTKFADEAVHIGSGEASNSYLNLEKIIIAAKESIADAIHPGYGFLSERPELSQACRDHGIAFIGPSAEAMHKLGSKVEAKILAQSVGVPVVPGFFQPGASVQQLEAAAEEIGYPVMLKASAGGGGRGMRVVIDPSTFRNSFAMASEEAQSAFGDGTMMVEKLIERPRHIEVQVLADSHGHVATLFERECSIQRRHQKLIEEAPSPVFGEGHELTPLWFEMSESARNLIREAGYVGAGTVEYILDESAGRFYFLEVNARLQVEHPVTEAVTGLDLVEWQIRIANGERLSIDPRLVDGERSALFGHSIEVRVVAEDPARGFLPSVGKILAWEPPTDRRVRVDSGFGLGQEISRFYDSLIAKVITHGATREEAIRRMVCALEEFHILGVQTNIAFLLEVIRHPGFRSGEFDTGFLARAFADWKSGFIPEELSAIIRVAESSGSAIVSPATSVEHSSWDANDSFRNSAK
jgi:acetyl/propionyl-CoA carboxylase alpha subunit